MERKFIRKLPLPTPDNWVWWVLIVGAFATIVVGGIFLTSLALRAGGLWSPEAPTPSVTRVPSPSLMLRPAQGRPGIPVTVSGRGWPAGETVTLRLAAPPGFGTVGVDFLTTTVAENGTFVASMSIPVVRPWSEFPTVRVEAIGATANAGVGGIKVTAVFSLATPRTPAGSPEPSRTPGLPANPSATASAAVATSTPTPTPTPVTLTPTPTATPDVSTWRGEYYNNITLWGTPAVVREDANLTFDWGTAPPARGVLADGFSARWTRSVVFPAGVHRFYAAADDGVRVILDGQVIIEEWHSAQPRIYTVDRTLVAGAHQLVVEYYELYGNASVRFWWDRPDAYPEWRGDYYDNPQLQGEPVLTRNDAVVDFDWGTSAPANGIPRDKFSVRWTRMLPFDAGTYRFRVVVDDGTRLYVDGTRVIDAWQNGAAREVTGDITLTGGTHEVRLDYYDAGGDAVVQLVWERAGSYKNWRGEYWRNTSLDGLPALVRDDERIDFVWLTASPSQVLPVDNFSARWQRVLPFGVGTYRFSVLVDDGARLWVDGRLAIDAWQDGGSRELTADLALAQGEHTLELEYYERAGQALVRLTWEEITPVFPDWRSEYWSNRNLSGPPALVRNDRAIDFEWGQGAPAVGLPVDGFSARWSRTLSLEEGVYSFRAVADDGVRVSIDGDRVIDAWFVSSGDVAYTAERALTSGEHTIVVDYFENSLDAKVSVAFKRLGGLPTPTAPPTETPAPTATPTDVPEATPTTGATPTPKPTLPSTPTPTVTPEPSLTPSPTETPTPLVTPTTGVTPIATPTESLPSAVYINEVMPVAGTVDWNGDGKTDDGDAWIELHNPTGSIASLAWWVIDIEGSDQHGYTLLGETSIPPLGYLVVTGAESGMRFTEGLLRLRNDTVVLDSVELRVLEPDESLSRDNQGVWRTGWTPTPGEVNRPPISTGRGR